MTEQPLESIAKAAAGGRGRELAALVRSDREGARRVLAELPLADQTRAICELPANLRADALALVPDPAAVVRRMPEIDLCATAVATGPERAGWFLAHATGEQIVACFDLDAWRGDALAPDALDSWLTGLADAGDATLIRTARALDPELLAIWFRRSAEMFFRRGEDEDWEPPDGCQTLDGEYFFRPKRADVDLELPIRLLRLLFENDQPIYLALAHDACEGTSAVDEEQALSWRAGRLVDLGFPGRDEALAAYAWLDPETCAELPPDATAPREESSLPARVARPLLPYPLFEAIAGLPDEERDKALVAFMQLANKVLVAEGMSLGDADAVRTAMERAAELASHGLDAVAQRNGLTDEEVVRRVPLERLFRIGANLTGARTELLRRADERDSEPPEDEPAES